MDKSRVANARRMYFMIDTDVFSKLKKWIWREERRPECVVRDAFLMYIDVKEGRKQLVDVEPEVEEPADQAPVAEAAE